MLNENFTRLAVVGAEINSVGENAEIINIVCYFNLVF